ncbi:hypothetical protein [Mycoplasma struthionis]|uniref:Uncharacterized protein n=1 Tax=Mycoplasma struthionis TaxID=538220 RepID=A0A502M9H3_9MOLU|nr:hypothetical protein [Mycoplasma struthionis]TPI02814.1 hypothetical protein FJM01_00265 [Mycoplasma struthionis]
MDNLNEANKTKPLSKKKKVVSTTILLSLSVLTIASTVTIQLAINKHKVYKKTKYFNDFYLDKDPKIEKINEDEQLVTFRNTPSNEAKIMSLEPKILKGISSLKKENGIKYSLSLNFHSIGNEFKKYYDSLNNNESHKLNEVQVPLGVESYIYELDLLNILNLINNKAKKDFDQALFLRSISSINFSMTYFFKKDNKIFYYDHINEYIGYSIVEFFKNIRIWLSAFIDSNPDAIIKINKASLKAKVKINPESHKIEDLKFENEIVLKTENRKPQR